MSLSLLVDMNLAPDWIPFLKGHGIDAVHWSAVGNIDATDAEIMEWARQHGHAVLTHDLDFGALLALTHRNGPSVMQVRAKNVLPDGVGAHVVAATRLYEAELLRGALVVVEAGRQRVRILPI